MVLVIWIFCAHRQPMWPVLINQCDWQHRPSLLLGVSRRLSTCVAESAERSNHEGQGFFCHIFLMCSCDQTTSERASMHLSGPVQCGGLSREAKNKTVEMLALWSAECCWIYLQYNSRGSRTVLLIKLITFLIWMGWLNVRTLVSATSRDTQ